MAATTFVALFALLLAFFLADPFHLGPLSSVDDFSPVVFKGPPLSSLSHIVDPSNRMNRSQLRFAGDLFGPESLAFDAEGRGPYAGISDGRVVRWMGEEKGWETVAVASPNRNSSRCEPAPGSPPFPKLPLEHVCGRPLGLRFHPVSGDLYFADAYWGLFRVPLSKKAEENGEPQLEDKEGETVLERDGEMEKGRVGFGEPELLTNSAEGDPEGSTFLFTNDLDFGKGGEVYFTDTSTKYQRRQFLLSILEGDSSGRLLRFDPSTNKTSVLLSGLSFPNGVSLSSDASFLVFCETIKMRCNRYWLKGEKAGSVEVFADLPGFPDNIRRNPRGRFWVALHCRRTAFIDFLGARPFLRTALLRLIPHIRLVYLVLLGMPHGFVVELDENGTVTTVLEDKRGQVVRAVSEVEERDGNLWLGSVLMPHVAVYDLASQ